MPEPVVWSVLAFLAGVLIGCLGTVAKFGGDVRVLAADVRGWAEGINHRLAVLEAWKDGRPAPAAPAPRSLSPSLSQGL